MPSVDPQALLAELSAEPSIDANALLAELNKPESPSEPVNPFADALELNRNLEISAVGDVGVASRFADVSGALRQLGGTETPQLFDEFISEAQPEIPTDVTRVPTPTGEQLATRQVGAIREQPEGVISSAFSGLGGVRDRIAAQGRKNTEFVENLNNKINTEFPVDPEGPKGFNEFENLVTRTILKTVTGFAGFTGGTLPSLLDPGEIAPEGSETPTIDVFEELGEGIVELPARAAVVVDNLVDKALGALSDGAIGSPIAGAIRQEEAGQQGPIGGALLSLFGSGTINGKQLTEKDRQKVLRDAIERSEEIVFGLLIASGGPKAVRRARGKTKAQLSESVSAKDIEFQQEVAAEIPEAGREFTPERAGELFENLTERISQKKIRPEVGAEIAKRLDEGVAAQAARIRKERKAKTDKELSKGVKLDIGEQKKLPIQKPAKKPVKVVSEVPTVEPVKPKAKTVPEKIKELPKKLKDITPTQAGVIGGAVAVPAIAALGDKETGEKAVEAAGLLGLAAIGRKLKRRGKLSAGEAAKSGLNSNEFRAIKDAEDVFNQKPNIDKGLGGQRNALTRLQTALTSEFTPLRVLERDVHRAAGRKAPKQDLAATFELFAGSRGKADADFIDFKSKVVSPVVHLAQDAQTYLFLKRTQDRLLTDPKTRKVGKWTLDKVNDGLSGLKKKLGDDFGLVEESGKQFQTEMNKSLKLQVESGRMTQEVFDAIKSKNNFYAPFKVLKYFDDIDVGRIRGTGRNIASKEQLTKVIKGISEEDLQLGDFWEAASEQIYKSRILAEKNNKMLELDKVAELDETGTFIRRVDAGTRPKEGFGTVEFLKEGEPTALEVPLQVERAIQGMTVPEAGVFTKALTQTAIPFRWGATSANAAFQMVNLFFADLPRQAIVSKFGLKSPKDVYQYPMDWAYSLATSFTGNFGKPNKLYMDYLRSGAANSTIQRELTPTAFQQTLDIPQRLSFQTPLNAGKSVLNSVARMGNAIEETSKILGYKRGVRLGGLDRLPSAKAQAKLAEIATEVRRFSGSPDFLRRGTAVKELNLLFMFMNARIQGVGADFSRLAGKTGGKEAASAWAKLSTAVGVPATTLMLYNLSEENKEDYFKIPEWERENYFMIPRGHYFINENGERVRDYYRIPKRETVKLFANMIESFIQFADTKEPQKLQDYGVEFLENISPVNIQGEGFQQRLESVMSGLNPLLKVPAEQASNRDFFRHRNIIPFEQKNAPPELQFKQFTPEIFKRIGKATGTSPLRLESATRGLTAGLVTQAFPPEGKGRRATNILAKRFVRSQFIAEKKIPELEKFTEEQSAERLTVKRKAQKVVDDIKNLSPESQQKALRQTAKADIEVARKAKDLLKEDRLGLTFQERRIRQLGVENEARAKFIVSQIKDLTPKERRDFLIDFKRKNILTNRVQKQVNRLLIAERRKK